MPKPDKPKNPTHPDIEQAMQLVLSLVTENDISSKEATLFCSLLGQLEGMRNATAWLRQDPPTRTLN